MIIPHVQQFSGDGLIRLPQSALYRLTFSHLYTELLISERGAAPPRCVGITEWTARWHERLVASLAWDWMLLDDGALVESLECPIRTNLMLTNEKGYDLGSTESEQALQQHIRELNWRPIVLHYLTTDEAVISSGGCGNASLQLHHQLI